METTWSLDLALALVGLVALTGWAIGLLAAGRREPETPTLRVKIRLDPARTVSPMAVLRLRQRVGQALVRCYPEIALDFVDADTPDVVAVRIESAGPDAPLMLSATGSVAAQVIPEQLDADAGTTGEVVAAWLLLGIPGPMTAEAAAALAEQDDRHESRLLAAQARARLPTDDPGAIKSQCQRLRNLLETWPGDAAPEDRLRLKEMLATTLVAARPSPRVAHQAYEALDLVDEILRAHWAAGRIADATAAQHLAARVRLALGQAEQEPRHLEAERVAIAHALAHGPRGRTPAHRAADLAVLGAIELALAAHEPGTAALQRAAAASREAIGLTDLASADLAGRLLTAISALTALGEREASEGPLEEAIGLARQAVRISPNEPAVLALAQALLALGELTGRSDLISEALAHIATNTNAASRMLHARALEDQGRLRLDAVPIKQAVAVWRALAEDPDVVLTRSDRRRQAGCVVMAARLSSEPGLLDEAVTLARAIREAAAYPSVAAALDEVFLGEALLTRARARIADTAGAVEAEACLAAALDLIGTEPLPHLKGRIDSLRRQARRLAEVSHAPSVEERAVEPLPPTRVACPEPAPPSLDTIAATLDQMAPAAEAHRLAEARRLLLLRLDARSDATGGLHDARDLDWLERIDRAQGRSR